MSLLVADNIAVSFGGIKAVQDVSFDVEAGEVFSIVGPNGAGKTTIFNLISRIYDMDHGSVVFDGQDITALPTHAVAELGIARTFQNTELFEQETVLKNLLIGCHIHRRTNLLSDFLFILVTYSPGFGTLPHSSLITNIFHFIGASPARNAMVSCAANSSST